MLIHSFHYHGKYLHDNNLAVIGESHENVAVSNDQLLNLPICAIKGVIDDICHIEVDEIDFEGKESHVYEAIFRSVTVPNEDARLKGRGVGKQVLHIDESEVLH